MFSEEPSDYYQSKQVIEFTERGIKAEAQLTWVVLRDWQQ